MEPMMKTKREVATLVPYRRTDKGLEFFLQQRGMNPHPNAGLLDIFGGGLEAGETLEEALLREIREELEYVPRAYTYFSRYENSTHTNNVFFEEVDGSFENMVNVHEGTHGKFLTLEEAAKAKVFTQALLILQELSRMLAR